MFLKFLLRFFERENKKNPEMQPSLVKFPEFSKEPIRAMFEKSSYIFERFLNPFNQVELGLNPESQLAVIVVRATAIEDKMFFSILANDQTPRSEDFNELLLHTDHILTRPILTKALSIETIIEKMEDRTIVPVFLHFPIRSSNEYQVIGTDMPIRQLSDLSLIEFMIETYKLQLKRDSVAQ